MHSPAMHECLKETTGFAKCYCIASMLLSLLSHRLRG